jgi:G3E family GTPase
VSTPLVLVTGIDADAMASTMIGLQWDAPRAVTVRHAIDVSRQVLTRVVSDVDGVVERTHLDLDHACVSCALREDVMPTIERLADDGRWGSIIAHLPVAAEATQVCRILSYDDALAAKLHVAAVLSVVNGPTAHADLLGDDLLCERGLHTSAEDRRGVAEVQGALIEYADVVVVVGPVADVDLDVAIALARPGADVVHDHLEVDVAALVAGRRPHDEAEAWVDPTQAQSVGDVEIGSAWTIELVSDRPFHPDRLLQNIEGLGGGARRSRGCFWLPTRPDAMCEWNGAGGQLSVGPCDHGIDPPQTRILVTGIDGDRDRLQALFRHCLVSDDELMTRGVIWESRHDGFEQWLGPIHLAA